MYDRSYTNASSSVWLNDLLDSTPALEAVADFLEPAALFDAFAYPQSLGLRRFYEQHFEVVAGPGEALEAPLRPGDLLLRRALGEGNLAHLSVLASGQTMEAEDLEEAGLSSEATSGGLFAEVVEAGPQRTTVARRLANAEGRLGRDQLVLRLREAPTWLGSEAEPGVIDPTSPDLRIDPADPRIDVVAKFALQRMIKRPDMAVDAARLIRGINGGTLAGIFGENLLAAAKLAQKLGTVRWKLVPKGEAAALILDPEAPTVAPPTIIFRVKEEKPPGKRVWPLPPERMDPALQKASRTFALFQQRELVPCASSPSAIPVPNLVPPSFCQLPGRDLLVVITEAGDEPSLPGPAIVGAQVQVEGPSPSRELATQFTDESGQAQFQHLALGSYQVTASKEGFEAGETQIVLADDQLQPAQFAGKGGPIAAPAGPRVVPLQLAPSKFPGIEAFIALDRSKGPPPTFVGPNTKVRWEDVQFQWKNKGSFSRTKLFLIVRHKATGQEFFNRQIRDYAAMPPQEKRPIVDNQTTDTAPLSPLSSTPFGIVECELKMVNLSGQSVDKKTLQLTIGNEIRVKITNPAGTPLGKLEVHLIEPAGVHEGKAVKTNSGGEIILTDPEFGKWTLVAPPDLMLVPKASPDSPFPVKAIDDLEKRKGKPDTSEHIELKRNVVNEFVARQMFFVICPQCGVTFRIVKDTKPGAKSKLCPNDSFDLTSLEKQVDSDPTSFTTPATGQDLTKRGAKSRGIETLVTAHGSVTVHWDESRFLDFQAGDYILGTPTATTITIIGRDTWGAKPIKTVPKDPKTKLLWEFHEAPAFPDPNSSPPYTTAVPRSENRRLNTVFRWMTIHHTTDPAQNSSKTVKDLQDKHHDPTSSLEDPEERADIGYHFVIDADGKVYEGRPIGIEGSHVGKFNAANVGIVLAGDFESRLKNSFNPDKPTAAALAALGKLVGILAERFGIKSVWSHRERNGQAKSKATECPGGELIPHVEGLRKKFPGPPP